MNDKENELYRILDIVIQCCATKVDEERMSVTKEDVLGRSRAENVVMTRCVLVAQIIGAGYSTTTAAQLLNRDIHTIRHLIELGYNYQDTSKAYRIALAQATLLCQGNKK